MRELRHAVGLRALASGSTAKVAKVAKSAVPSFKQYREKNGQFYFKLIDEQGQLVLQSLGFESPKAAGQTIARLQTEGVSCLPEIAPLLEPVQAGHAQVIAELLNKMESAKVIK